MCDNKQSRLENRTYLKHMLLDQHDPAYGGPGGALRILCFPCFLGDNGKNLRAKELYKFVQQRIEASRGRKRWGNISWKEFEQSVHEVLGTKKGSANRVPQA